MPTILSERQYGENTLTTEQYEGEAGEHVCVNGQEVYNDEEAGEVTPVQMARRVLSAIQETNPQL